MKFSEIRRHLDGVPYISTKYARRLYDFILEKKPDQCLELGFAHGTTCCYIAAALDELGEGHVTAVDLERGREWQKPSIEELLAKTGLASYVTAKREKLSYTWFLKKKIEEQTTSNHCEPVFDFCYIDGPKNWTNDGFAFFLVDKLLRVGGHVLFDDLTWTYANTDEWSLQKLEEYGCQVSEMDEDERSIPHIELVFRLLVMQQPGYSEFIIEDENWGWAQKTGQPSKSLAIRETLTLTNASRRLMRKLLARLPR